MLDSNRAVLMVGVPAGVCAAAVAPAEMPLSFAPFPDALSWTGASAAGWKGTPALSPAEWSANVLAARPPALPPELLVELLACPAPLPEPEPVLFPEPLPAELPEPFWPSAPVGAPATGVLAPAADAEGCCRLAACGGAPPPLERAGVCHGAWVTVEALSNGCAAGAPPTFAGSAGPIVFAGTLAGIPEGPCAACSSVADLPASEVVWAVGRAATAGSSAAEPACMPAEAAFALSPVASSGALVSSGKAAGIPAREAEACTDCIAKTVPLAAVPGPLFEAMKSVEG